MEILSLLWSPPLHGTAVNSPMWIAATGDVNLRSHG
jgi:hypothetical protein